VFAEFGTGDAYCFDYRQPSPQTDPPVVRWSNESGECVPRSTSFTEFLQQALAGALEED
jgi:hypothetical protein